MSMCHIVPTLLTETPPVPAFITSFPLHRSGLLPTPQIRFGWKLSTPFPRKSGYCSPPQPMPIVLVISYNIDLILMVSIPDTRYQDGIQPDSYVAMSEKHNILMTHPSLELPPAPDWRSPSSHFCCSSVPTSVETRRIQPGWCLLNPSDFLGEKLGFIEISGEYQQHYGDIG